MKTFLKIIIFIHFIILIGCQTIKTEKADSELVEENQGKIMLENKLTKSRIFLNTDLERSSFGKLKINIYASLGVLVATIEYSKTENKVFAYLHQRKECYLFSEKIINVKFNNDHIKFSIDDLNKIIEWNKNEKLVLKNNFSDYLNTWVIQTHWTKVQSEALNLNLMCPQGFKKK